MNIQNAVEVEHSAAFINFPLNDDKVSLFVL